MPNTHSGKKRQRQSVVRRNGTSRPRASSRPTFARFAKRSAAASSTRPKPNSASLQESSIKRPLAGIIHRNVASRLKSRLSAALKAAKQNPRLKALSGLPDAAAERGGSPQAISRGVEDRPFDARSAIVPAPLRAVRTRATQLKQMPMPQAIGVSSESGRATASRPQIPATRCHHSLRTAAGHWAGRLGQHALRQVGHQAVRPAVPSSVLSRTSTPRRAKSSRPARYSA